MTDQQQEEIMEQLGWCGCGQPWFAIEYLSKVLNLISSLSSDKAWKDFYPEWKKQEDELFPIPGSSILMYYVLDEKGLTEHGGSVPGWLSAEGIELMNKINEYERTSTETNS